jgi:hypothetical protein
MNYGGLISAPPHAIEVCFILLHHCNNIMEHLNIAWRPRTSKNAAISASTDKDSHGMKFGYEPVGGFNYANQNFL